MKHVFIVNPLAGGGKSLKILKKIEKVCTEKNIDYTIRLTKAPKDATKIAREYENLQCIIYSVGGDGTMNEVLNGIVGSKNLFGILPAGSGNDFHRLLMAMDEISPTIDIGKINDRYFINIACIGIDADVANNVNIMKKTKIPPSQIYNISILYTFFKYKYKNLEFNLNNSKIKDKFTLLAICNGKYYGGGYKIAPNAELSDGLFDIYFAKKISKLRIPSLFLKLIKGSHEKSPIVHKGKSDSLIIKTDEDIVCNVDGEQLIARKFKVQIIQNAITLYNNKELTEEFLAVN